MRTVITRSKRTWIFLDEKRSAMVEVGVWRERWTADRCRHGWRATPAMGWPPMGSTTGMAHRWGRHWRAAPALRPSRHRPNGGAAARLPRVLVRLAAPDPGARRRRLSGGRARPTRLQHLRQATPGARLPTRVLAQDVADLIGALG